MVFIAVSAKNGIFCVRAIDEMWVSVPCGADGEKHGCFSFVLSIDQFSESRSDDVSERRLSEDARSGLTRKEAKIASIFLPKKLFYKETLGVRARFLHQAG